jgi:hypothetical protein
MGRRGAALGRGGKGAARKGKGKGGGHLGFCERKETTPQMSSDFASNDPQSFPTSMHRRSTFGQHFFSGILHIT